MIGLPANTRVSIAADHTGMRTGFDGLSALVQTALADDPFCGHVFVFRGRRGDIDKVLRLDGHGLMLPAKRLERGRFFRPQAHEGRVALTSTIGLLGRDTRQQGRCRDTASECPRVTACHALPIGGGGRVM